MDYSTVGNEDSASQYFEHPHLQANDDADLFFPASEGVDAGAMPTYFSRMSESYRHSPGRYTVIERGHTFKHTKRLIPIPSPPPSACKLLALIITLLNHRWICCI